MFHFLFKSQTIDNDGPTSRHSAQMPAEEAHGASSHQESIGDYRI